jgi:GH35 family endo-1,4-beta-xylanase
VQVQNSQNGFMLAELKSKGLYADDSGMQMHFYLSVSSLVLLLLNNHGCGCHKMIAAI